MSSFATVNDLRIGKVLEVKGTKIKIELDDQLVDLTRSYNGKVYSIGQIASVMKIHFGKRILFLNVRLLRMNSENEEEDSSPTNSNDSRIIEADLFGEGKWNKSQGRLDFIRGVELYPLPLQSVYLMTDPELEKLYESAGRKIEVDANSPTISIGTYTGTNQKVVVDANKLFGHHCAILGSTGSGKSGTVSAILHSLLEKELYPRILMIDPHGEYSKAFRERAVIYNAYSEANASTSDNEISLPYWLMTSDELRSLIIGKTEYEATSQNNIVYQAVEYARLTEQGIIERFDSENSYGNAEYKLAEGHNEEEIFSFDRDKPLPFKLEDFEYHIDKIQGRKIGQLVSLAASSSERQRVESILKKLKLLRSTPQLAFMMKEYENESPTLSYIISQFIGNPEIEKPMRIIDISGLPNEVAGLLTALVARLSFQYKLWQKREEREKDPILFVCEEAHRYVPNYGEAQYKEAQVAIRRIAKEGRKYGLGLMLVSQRPSDLESTVLSQCNSWIVLRLTNTNDQSFVSNFIPDSLSGLTNILPSLTQREAIFIGEAAVLPSRIKINELSEEELPDSSNIDYIKGWQGNMTSIEEIEVVTKRWSDTT